MDDTEKTKKKTKKDDIQWHPAFVVAIQGILIDYSNALDYKIEHPMPTKSLRIDVLVIKKRRNTVIKKQLAEIFRLENIVEYKSPRDYLSISEFHKALARTHIYRALTKNVEITDMTLSFVVTSHPRNLFLYLSKVLGYAVEEKHPGIYVVTGAVVPIQIINIRELSDEENLWLHNLNLNIPKENARWVSGVDKKYGERIDTSVYVSAIALANQDKFNKEDHSMWNARTLKIFEELGYLEQWRKNAIEEGLKEGLKEGELKGRLKIARAMFAEGDSLAKIARVTEIPIKRLKKELKVS